MTDPLRTPLALLFIVLCALAASRANSAEPPSPPPEPSLLSAGTAVNSKSEIPSEVKSSLDIRDISEWAWAGVLWSDANLVKGVAKRAASESDDEQETQKLMQVSKEAQQIVEQMEQMGWQRLASKPVQSGTDASVRSSKQVARPQKTTKQQSPKDLDIDQYRVTNVDEPVAERKSLAEKIEDQVEKSIAAAGDRGVSKVYGAHISNRETQTRSGTLPYATDSIYDVDDYDQDGDYFVENAGGKYAEFDDEDVVDDVDEVRTINPDVEVAVDNPEPKLSGQPSTEDSSVRSSDIAQYDIAQYTDVSERRAEDARWVQLHVSSNQMLFDKLTEGGIDKAELQLAINQLRVHLSLAQKAGVEGVNVEALPSVASN
ncbi:hypothetical protein LOC67_14420 [Stieleria sp. JC731]|uniref:hypothetical protein n=1 Tax=Pirellulaceae TaxID=2691357 RepID=UPI001E502815|nr:hypothetical protein [Stieleria sp. JC731]MCC9601751.1 hypothetical protein [Stieleria sp. JC731]